jgi:S1-C subfamily serine protease
MTDKRPYDLSPADGPQRSDVVAAGSGDNTGQKVDNPSINEAQWPLFKKAVSVTVEIQTDDGTGAGVIVTSDGLILTAYHVVKDAKKIVVRRCSLQKKSRSLVCRGKYLVDVIIEDKQADIAVLKMRRPPKNLPSCTLGDSDNLEKNAPLYRVGRDQVPLAAGYLLSFGRYNRIAEIEIGMPNAPGASGGPIFDIAGRVVAIALRGNFESEMPPCSFAIPISAALRRLLKNKTVRQLLGDE